MSKESKPVDLWRHVFASGHDRPNVVQGVRLLPRAVHGVHRAEYTACHKQPLVVRPAPESCWPRPTAA